MRIRTLLYRLPFLLALGAGAAATLFLAVYLPVLLAPVAILERAFSLAAALAEVCADDPPESKISKLILLFLPWTGAIVCFALLPGRRKEGDPPAPAGARRAEYFAEGREMYERLLADLARAKKRVYLEYYIVAAGVFRDSVFSCLAACAARGADVRFLYDDFGCALTRRRAFVRRLEGLGIRTACFRPIRFKRGMSRRDHRKIAVVDDAVYTGGINIADEYIGEKIRFGHWKDTAVRAEGSIAEYFADLFLRSFARAARKKNEKVPSVPPTERSAAEAISCVAVFDGADGETRTAPAFLGGLAARAMKTLYLCTPYLAPDGASVHALASAAARGVDVRILIPHIPDKKSVFFLTRSYARELEGAGVKVREYAPGFLHAKSAVLDGAYAFVSSYNLDFRSLYLQAECGILFKSEEVAIAAERDFLACWAQGIPLKRAGRAASALGKLCRIFTPLV